MLRMTMQYMCILERSTPLALPTGRPLGPIVTDQKVFSGQIYRGEDQMTPVVS